MSDLSVNDLLNDLIEKLSIVKVGDVDKSQDAVIAALQRDVAMLRESAEARAALDVKGSRSPDGKVDTFRVGSSTWTFDRTHGFLEIKKV
jgi:hypothetical protein